MITRIILEEVKRHMLNEIEIKKKARELSERFLTYLMRR